MILQRELARKLLQILKLKSLCFLFISIISWNGFIVQGQVCDEVPISVQMKFVGEMEMAALICEKEVFLSINELFNFLKIKSYSQDHFNTLEGYILNQDDLYKIDIEQGTITYKNQVHEISESNIQGYSDGIYLKIKLIHEIFGLKSNFNFRSLSVILESEEELPYIKEAMRNKLRTNIRFNHLNPIADTTLFREKTLFDFGTTTWNIYSTQRSDGVNFERVSLGLGGMLLGGELSGRLNFLTNQPLDSRNQFYRWRMVNNDNKLLRQLTVGKISVDSRSSIFNPVIGVQVTNTPTYRKRSFGTYIHSDYTKPGWTVELYINNVLLDFTKADSSGLFSFEIPLIYGNTSIDIRYYGPYGEEEFSKKEINIPYNFQEKGNFEYDVSLGAVEDANALFGQSKFSYGLTQNLTLGGGMEYLSSLEKHQILPFVNGSFSIKNQIIVSSEFIPKVGYNTSVNYRNRNNYILDFYYARYHKDQTAVLYNYTEERSLILSSPVNFGSFKGTSRLSYRQTLLGANNYSNIEWLLNSNLKGINANLYSRAQFSKFTDPYIFSCLSFSIGLPGRIVLTPQLEYNYVDNKVTSIRSEFSKQIFKNTYLRSTIEHNLKYNQLNLNFGINVGLGFTRLGLTSNISNQYNSFSQILSGGVDYSSKAEFVSLDERISLGQANIKFMAFLDVNGNDKRDSEEPVINGLDVHSSQGGRKQNLESGGIVFQGLEPYVPHYFSFNSDQIQNIAWTLDYKSLTVTLNPNQIKLVEIPVNVQGEISGYIESGQDPVGGLRLFIENKEGKILGSVVTETDGFFNYFGLPSGTYGIQMDSIQLRKLGFKEQSKVCFEIQNGKEGDYLDNLLINITPQIDSKIEHFKAIGDTIKVSDKNLVVIENEMNQYQVNSITNNADKNPNIHKTTDSVLGISFSVQVFTSKKILTPILSKFKELTDIKFYRHKGNFAYIYGRTGNYEKALSLRDSIRKKGYSDAFVVYFLDGRRISGDELQVVYDLQKNLSDTLQIKSNANSQRIDPSLSTIHEAIVTNDIRDINYEHQTLAFKVQLVETGTLPSNDISINWLPGLTKYGVGPNLRYLVGGSKNLKKSVKIRNSLKQLGFNRASVVPLYNDSLLSPLQALGRVVYKDKNKQNGMVGISIGIYDNEGVKINTYLTEADGKFYILGLNNGNYIAKLEHDVLNSSGMKAVTASIPFKVNDSRIHNIENINFELEPELLDVAGRSNINEANSSGLIYKIQILASNLPLPKGHSLFKGLRNVQMYRHNGLFKYTYSKSQTLEEARKLKQKLKEYGFLDAFIVTFYNDKRLSMLELVGRIFIEEEDLLEGIEGIKLEIYQKASQNIVTTLASSNDGYFNFLGLRPGKYFVRLNKRQLQKLKLTSVDSEKEFEIVSDNNGSSALHKPLTFILKSLN